VRIAIEGGIGSGKTSTAVLVAERLACSVVLEQTATHPFLADFYADIEKYKLETELAFVLLHYHQLHVLDEVSPIVSDFAPGKDLIFARLNLSGKDLELFELLYDNLSGRILPPNITVFLDLPITTLMERILNRARSYELDMQPDYLERLLRFYKDNLNVLGPRVHVLSLAGTEAREEVADKVLSLIETSPVPRHLA